jgi:hypothetical protein
MALSPLPTPSLQEVGACMEAAAEEEVVVVGVEVEEKLVVVLVEVLEEETEINYKTQQVVPLLLGIV